MILSYIRTIMLHLVLIFSLRLMGKRQIGQMEASEFAVAMLAADLAAIPIQDNSIPLIAGLVPILTVLGLELVFSGLIMGSIRFRQLLCGKPVILIDNGKVLQQNMRKTRITLDELMGLLRQKDVLEISTVQYAILETNGDLSVFPYPAEKPAGARDAGVAVGEQYLPIPIIEDGNLFSENLKKSGKNEKWLEHYMKKQKITPSRTFLLTVDQGGNVHLIKKEDSA